MRKTICMYTCINQTNKIKALQQAISKLYTHASIMQAHNAQDQFTDLGLWQFQT